MDLGKTIIDQIHGKLRDQGLGDFQVQKLELFPDNHPSAKAVKHPDYLQDRMMSDIQTSLKVLGGGHLRITRLEIGLRLSSPCQPDEVPTQVCVDLPGGGVRCETKCIKRQAGGAVTSLPTAHV